MVLLQPTSTLFPYTTLFRSTNRKISILRSDEERGLEISVGFVSPTHKDQEEASGLGLPASTVARARKIQQLDRKSTRLNSSHRCISYAVFCLKKKTLY